MYTAVFLLCTQALLCEPYVDRRVYETSDSCHQGGTFMYDEVLAAASETDFVVGDCFETEQPLTKEQAKALAETKFLGDLIKKGSI